MASAKGDTAVSATKPAKAPVAPAATPQPAANAPAAAPPPAAPPPAASTATAATAQDTSQLCSTINGSKGAQPAKPGPDPLAVNQSEYDGWKMFHVYCFRCHGEDAVGGGIAPDLRHSVGPLGTVNHECFIYTVTNGRLAKGMPTWKPLLEPQQMENIYHYLLARSSGRLVPGRPHPPKQGS